MKTTRNILLALSLLGCTAGVASAQTSISAGIHIGSSGRASVDLGFFYDNLSSYGNWIERPSYGWVWTPSQVPRAGAPIRTATGSGPTRGGPGSPKSPTAGPPITTAAGTKTLRSAGPGSLATSGRRHGSTGRRGTTTSVGLRFPPPTTSTAATGMAMTAATGVATTVATATDTAAATATTPATGRLSSPTSSCPSGTSSR